jgi:transglutaminase superfamily protein
MPHMPPTRRCGMGARMLRLWQLWWVVRAGVWLCGLPVLLRLYSVPGLLQRLTPGRGRQPPRPPRELEPLVALVEQLCHLRLFRGSAFPRTCLRQALALYYVCTRLGYPVTIHFGVAKVGEALDGHSWVTVEEQPVAERLPLEHWQVVYSYPAATVRAPRVEGRPLAGIEPHDGTQEREA